MIPLNNLLDSQDFSEVIPYTKVEHKTLSIDAYTTDFASFDDMKYAEYWQGEQFNYFYNRYGFRDIDVIPESIDIGAFGCSFTAGLGLPEHMLWHKLLGTSSYNFGVSGASTKSVFDLFLITSKHVKMKNAIFLLPSLNRVQIAATNPLLSRISYLSIVPSHKSELALVHGVDSELVYKVLPEEEQIKNFRNDAYLVDHIAKERGINVYLSTWDSLTYEVLAQLKLTHCTVLPLWCSLSQEQAESDLARDRKHPGPIHHQQWVDKIKHLIK